MAGADRPRSFADLLVARAEDDHAAILFEDETISYRAFIAEAAARAALLRDARREGPFHVGVLLENVPEYLYWIGAAALAGAPVVGINPTRRGAELAHDVRHTDCQLVGTHETGAGVLAGLDLRLPPEGIHSLRCRAGRRRLRLVKGPPRPPARRGAFRLRAHRELRVERGCHRHRALARLPRAGAREAASGGGRGRGRHGSGHGQGMCGRGVRRARAARER